MNFYQTTTTTFLADNGVLVRFVWARWDIVLNQESYRNYVTVEIAGGARAWQWKTTFSPPTEKHAAEVYDEYSAEIERDRSAPTLMCTEWNDFNVGLGTDSAR